MTRHHRTFFRQLFRWTLLILTIPLALLTWFTGSAVQDFSYQQTRAELLARSELIKGQLARLLDQKDLAGLDRLIKTIGPEAGTRITVIASDGLVLADSQNDPARMQSHANRPEFILALAQGQGFSTRHSSTLNERLMYAAIPLRTKVSQQPAAVLRLAVPVSDIDLALKSIQLRLLLTALAIILAAVTLAWLFSRRLSRPLEQLTLNADHYARGEFSRDHLADNDQPMSREVAGLSQAMKRMARQLDEQISRIGSQRMQLETVLAGMIEGVIAVDMDQRILYLNHAACRLFQVRQTNHQGQPLEEVIRHASLLELMARSLVSVQPLEEELLLQRPQTIHLTVHGVRLLGHHQKQLGALLVLHDITRLKRLETMRRDFVANVSHELKTPITAIQGFVETLLDGALNDRQHAREFLEIIQRQSGRLDAIVDDLLSLSRLEEEIKEEQAELILQPLLPVLTEAARACAPKAEAKRVSLDLNCPGELSGLINEGLLEQAVVNLIVNAIKYSPEQSRVEIRGCCRQGHIEIQVIDEGVGIEARHLPRLFERFYRSDKARSRKLGGTGLGLAIVKHIMEGHHGSVTVQSRPGSGSTFTLFLPQPDQTAQPKRPVM
ncbi:MAG: PAS domain-containing protein [Desulfobulbaceae bacterium]|uniref:histidine kinase n=1 Tax=Candidatus Desulfatifera sulfidica TaxID=2841691 RepID=A0A8J6N854_9BACT|nr:PAS domain-containing protein [Candidatus Desulfatifera sulfidica]